jgi:hypothetical protein
MAEWNTAIDETVKFLQKEVYKIDPFGFDTERWRLHEEESDIRESPGANRLFSVSMSDDPSEPLMVGANCQDYNIFFNVVVCYEYHKTQKINARRDFGKIRNQLINADLSTLYNLDFHYFRVNEERYEINTETNFMYMIVPVLARYTVTH